MYPIIIIITRRITWNNCMYILSVREDSPIWPMIDCNYIFQCVLELRYTWVSIVIRRREYMTPIQHFSPSLQSTTYFFFSSLSLFLFWSSYFGVWLTHRAVYFFFFFFSIIAFACHFCKNIFFLLINGPSGTLVEQEENFIRLKCINNNVPKIIYFFIFISLTFFLFFFFLSSYLGNWWNLDSGKSKNNNWYGWKKNKIKIAAQIFTSVSCYEIDLSNNMIFFFLHPTLFLHIYYIV